MVSCIFPFIFSLYVHKYIIKWFVKDIPNYQLIYFKDDFEINNIKEELKYSISKKTFFSYYLLNLFIFSKIRKKDLYFRFSKKTNNKLFINIEKCKHTKNYKDVREKIDFINSEIQNWVTNNIGSVAIFNTFSKKVESNMKWFMNDFFKNLFIKTQYIIGILIILSVMILVVSIYSNFISWTLILWICLGLIALKLIVNLVFWRQHLFVWYKTKIINAVDKNTIINNFGDSLFTELGIFMGPFIIIQFLNHYFVLYLLNVTIFPFYDAIKIQLFERA